jgi:hypothetical protein
MDNMGSQLDAPATLSPVSNEEGAGSLRASLHIIPCQEHNQDHKALSLVTVLTELSLIYIIQIYNPKIKFVLVVVVVVVVMIQKDVT